MKKLKRSIQFFIKGSSAVGVILLCCTMLSLFFSNSTWGTHYSSFWTSDLPPLSELHLPGSPLHIINEVLMTIFFFSAGMEIKKEMLTGALNSLKRSLMPTASALGGMIVPAIIYVAFCHQKENIAGWGIPMATDIAFSLGVLSLLGTRTSAKLRVFLTAIAIIDDIGGILTIAIFYASGIRGVYFALALAVAAIMLVLNLRKVSRTWPYLVLGAILWYFVYNSGIHATIAGVVVAFLLPSPAIEGIERFIRVPVNFVILPLFALANTAIAFPADIWQAISSPIHFGVFAGLLAGKPIGILLATYLAVKSGLADLPEGMTLRQVAGVGILAGIGFTVSIFIAVLAFPGTDTNLSAKLGVISASLCSGIAGYLFLRLSSPRKR